MTLRLKGSNSGDVSLKAPATAGNNTITLPTSNGSAEQFVKNSGTAGELEYSSMVETSTGVGIGTSSPSRQLTLSHASQAEIGLLSGADTSGALIYQNASEQKLLLANRETDGHIAFQTGGANERARLDSSGRLGVGCTPTNFGANFNAVEIHSASGTNTYLALTNSTTGGDGSNHGFNLIASGDNATLLLRESGFINFSTNDTERMRITSDGALRASTNTSDSQYYGASTQYHVLHNDTNGEYVAIFEQSHGSNTYGILINYHDYAPDGSSNQFIVCSDVNATRFEVQSDGDVNNHDNSYGSLSDQKLKEDIVDAGSQWDDLKNLRVRKFKLKSDVAAYGDEAKTLIGLVAQEAETVSPGLVKDNPDLDDEGNDLGTTTKSVRYSVLYMKAIKALQEAQTRIETLETQNTAQQTQIDDLLARVTALEAA